MDPEGGVLEVVEDSVSPLVDALEEQAGILEDISSRILGVGVSGMPETIMLDPSEPVSIHLTRLFSVLNSSLEMGLADMVGIHENLAGAVRSLHEMTPSDEDEMKVSFDMAQEAFEQDLARMSKMKEVLDEALSDVEDALEGAEDGEIG